MTLYLSPEITPEEIRKAKATGVIYGVKSYPRGVTTGSDAGVESYERYYPVFAEMEKVGLVLNLHGEVPSNAPQVCRWLQSSPMHYKEILQQNITVMNAEAEFLQHLVKLHKDFPRLRIVLEHATTQQAVDTVGRSQRYAAIKLI